MRYAQGRTVVRGQSFRRGVSRREYGKHQKVFADDRVADRLKAAGRAPETSSEAPCGLGEGDGGCTGVEGAAREDRGTRWLWVSEG